MVHTFVDLAILLDELLGLSQLPCIDIDIGIQKTLLLEDVRAVIRLRTTSYSLALVTGDMLQGI
jgi:hypothetical protein